MKNRINPRPWAARLAVLIMAVAGVVGTGSVPSAGAAPAPNWFMLSFGNGLACASVDWGVAGGEPRLASCTHRTRDRVFTLVPDGSSVRIRLESNACLSVPDDPYYVAGDPVESTACSTDLLQLWRAVPLAGGVEFYQPFAGLCMDVAGTTLYSGLILNRCGLPSEIWTSTSVNEPTSQPLTIAVDFRNDPGCLVVQKGASTYGVTIHDQPDWQTWCSANSARTHFWYQPADNGGGAYVLADGSCITIATTPNRQQVLAYATCTAPVGNATLWGLSKLSPTPPTYLISNLAAAACIGSYDNPVYLRPCNPNDTDTFWTFTGAV
jgi:hypothetical protein